MPKQKEVGLSTDSYSYKSGYACFRLKRDGEVILESSKAATVQHCKESLEGRKHES